MKLVDSQSNDSILSHKLHAIMIFGPTAVGKTAFLEHCLQYMQSSNQKIEVISADSRQVYKGLHISSAYPDNKLLEKIPHHLLGIKELTENYTVFNFVTDAESSIRDICERGNIPLVLGGAAFYLYNLWLGVPQTPKADMKVREEIHKEYVEHGLEYMYTRLKDVDIEYAQKISQNDTYRILRALEIITQSGRKISEHEENGRRSSDIKYSVYGFMRDRENLYRRIDKRVDKMYDTGLLEECRDIWNNGITSKHNAYRTIGVQEFFENTDMQEFLGKGNLSENVPDTAHILEKIKRNSRRYAKRQLTFFKRFDFVIWYNLDKIECEGGGLGYDAVLTAIFENTV